MLLALRQSSPIQVLCAHARMHQGSRRVSAKPIPPPRACAFLRGSDPLSCEAPIRKGRVGSMGWPKKKTCCEYGCSEPVSNVKCARCRPCRYYRQRPGTALELEDFTEEYNTWAPWKKLAFRTRNTYTVGKRQKHVQISQTHQSNCRANTLGQGRGLGGACDA